MPRRSHQQRWVPRTRGLRRPQPRQAQSPALRVRRVRRAQRPREPTRRPPRLRLLPWPQPSWHPASRPRSWPPASLRPRARAGRPPAGAARRAPRWWSSPIGRTHPFPGAWPPWPCSRFRAPWPARRPGPSTQFSCSSVRNRGRPGPLRRARTRSSLGVHRRLMSLSLPIVVDGGRWMVRRRDPVDPDASLEQVVHWRWPCSPLVPGRTDARSPPVPRCRRAVRAPEGPGGTPAGVRRGRDMLDRGATTHLAQQCGPGGRGHMRPRPRQLAPGRIGRPVPDSRRRCAQACCAPCWRHLGRPGDRPSRSLPRHRALQSPSRPGRWNESPLSSPRSSTEPPRESLPSGAVSGRISIRHPVSRAASRAFCPSRPMASESW